MDVRVASRPEALTDIPEISPDLLAAAGAASRIGIHEYDLRSGALSWDDRVRELWGLGPAEPVTYGTFLSGVHPEDRAALERAMANALDPAGSGQFESEYRVIPARGGPPRWILATAQVSFESARPLRLLGTVLDTTARRQGTALQRAEELRLDAVRETARDGLMVFRSVRDGRGRLIDFVWLYANPAAGRITGSPSRWFAGRHLLEEMPENRSAGLFDGYVRVVESRVTWRHEFTYRLGADTRLMRLVAAPVGDGFAVLFSDLTDRRQADETIAERERRFFTPVVVSRWPRPWKDSSFRCLCAIPVSA